MHRHPLAFRDPSMQTVNRVDPIVNDERHLAEQRIWWSAVDAEFLHRFDFAVRADHRLWDEDCCFRVY